MMHYLIPQTKHLIKVAMDQNITEGIDKEGDLL